MKKVFLFAWIALFSFMGGFAAQVFLNSKALNAFASKSDGHSVKFAFYDSISAKNLTLDDGQGNKLTIGASGLAFEKDQKGKMFIGQDKIVVYDNAESPSIVHFSKP